MEDKCLNTRRKINSLCDIYDGNSLIIKDFIDLDLSNLDLSSISKEKWENCIFYNTSFRNTKIIFIPNKLANKAMKYCDFSYNDLTYLNRNDFCINNGDDEINTYGCDFTNTGINFLKTLRNLKLDSSYQEYDFDHEYWSFDYGTINWPDFIDIKTIINNPFLKVPSFRLLNAIEMYLREIMSENKITLGHRFDTSGKISFDFSGGEDIFKTRLIYECESFLKYDKQGFGKKLYNKLLPFMSLNERFEFFLSTIRYLNIKNVDFEDIPVEVLRYYKIQNNNFENIIFNYTLNDLLKFWSGGEHFLDVVDEYKNIYKNVYFSQIYYDSWQENLKARKRISDSAFTFFTKVYLELGRNCNAKCSFCRNKSFDDVCYNIEAIQRTLNEIKNYINAVIIGGGEPTLRLNDVKELQQSINKTNLDWHMFTNGTNSSIIDDDYIMDHFKLNLSRHAVSDSQNAEIFGIDKNNIMSSYDIERLNVRNKQVTLNAVCFNGGLDSFEKIVDYIKYAIDIGCRKVLIQDLQTELSLGSNSSRINNLGIDETIFARVREYLKNNGYKEKYPIYATGGYVSYILKNKDDFSVALQKYINQTELDREWGKAIKKTFDLSIDPSGNLYENWNQTTGLVKTLKK